MGEREGRETMVRVGGKEGRGGGRGTLGMVLRLTKPIYGLKQAGQRWYQTFAHIMAMLGLCPSDVDQGVFF